MTVYLDLLLLTNFAVNYGLLRSAASLTAARSPTLRLTLGAGLGAGYAALCLLPGLGFLAGDLWRTVFLLLMALTAFGLSRGLWRRVGILLGLSFSLGGLILLLKLRTWYLVSLAALALMLVCKGFFHGSLDRAGQLVPAEFTLAGQRVQLTALRDSGNSLADPFTGRPLLLVQGDAGGTLLRGLDLHDPAAAMTELRRRCPALRCRLIPYHALGGAGLLLAVQCEAVTVDGKHQNPYVAFSPERFSRGGEYQALTGGGQYA